ncbi:endonuclease/exonuclease/phosphatase family protein [Kribbella shirazensis]|uniref:Endonuclease/exonuclease/phosphatase family metal-dependent hydrolase n=1 Tax=Kribbella shirazensis TaxID=1105143 RepID=A0A7X6A447_9ACTN|nr:endonuclease/exonuclease/phosphatase family metal-dependent hydrolase [Kribbella shirazensis]
MEESVLRIASYNIQDGGHGRLESIAAILRELKPDAAAIVEANSRSNAEWLARELGYDIVFGHANNPFHIAWITRRPILGHHNHRHPVLSKTLLELDIDWDGQPLQLFATHLTPLLRQDREIRRLIEVEALLDVVRSRPDQHRILVGDFNTTNPSAPVTRILDDGFIDCYATVNPGQDGLTHPTDTPAWRIDFIFAGESLADRLRSCQVHAGDDLVPASDHFPVWATFT